MNLQINETEVNLNVKGEESEESKEVKVVSLITYQSVEAHRSTACSPVFMFCNISPSTSEDCIITKIWLITEDSLRIRPITMHQSRHPASMKMCSKYLYTEAETQWLMLGRSMDEEKGSRYQESSLHTQFAQTPRGSILCFQNAEKLTEAGPGICEALYSPTPWRCAPALTGLDWVWRNFHPPLSSLRPPWSYFQSSPWLNQYCIHHLMKNCQKLQSSLIYVFL